MKKKKLMKKYLNLKNNFHFPSLKSCGSSSSLKDFNKKPIIHTFSGTTREKKIKIHFQNYFILKEEMKNIKFRKVQVKLLKIFFQR